MLKRLPNLQAILQVYAVIAVMLSGWTITAFLWKLSAWLLLLNLGEIVTVFSYAMAANLLETLLILLVLLALCILLPSRVLRDDFVVRGTILSIGLIGAFMAFVGLGMQSDLEPGATILLGPIVILLLTGFALWFASRSRSLPSVRSAVLWISDRMMVFLFILIPLFVILTAYVLFRNIT